MSEHEHQWTAVHAIGSGLVKEHQCKCGATDSLSLAWAEVEAALPEGWEFALRRLSRLDTGPYEVEWSDGRLRPMGAVPVLWADTAAAALRAFAAKLAALPDPEHRRSER